MPKKPTFPPVVAEYITTHLTSTEMRDPRGAMADIIGRLSSLSILLDAAYNTTTMDIVQKFLNELEAYIEAHPEIS